EADPLPELDAEKADEAEEEPEDGAARELAPHDPPPVLQPYLAERERADDECARLRTAVAAARNYERQEERDDGRLFHLALKISHRRGGEHLAEEERREPAAALL